MSSKPDKKAVLIVQHVDYGNAAVVERSLNSQGIPTFVRHPYNGDEYPDISGIRGILSMGGPMGANDDAEHPWIKNECEYLKSCVDLGLPTVGICLGGQLLARALGAKVNTNPVAEAGWYPLILNEEGLKDPILSAAGASPVVYHWHTDTFENPEGSVPLASSRYCQNQAYRVSEKVYGFQFHPEADHQLVNLRFEKLGNEERLMKMINEHGTGRIQEPQYHKAMALQGERSSLKITAALTQIFREEPYQPVETGFKNFVASLAVNKMELTVKIRSSRGLRKTIRGKIYNFLHLADADFLILQEPSTVLWVVRLDDVHSIVPMDARSDLI